MCYFGRGCLRRDLATYSSLLIMLCFYSSKSVNSYATCEGVFLNKCSSTFTWNIHLITSSTAACSLCAFGLSDLQESIERRSPGATGLREEEEEEEEEGLGVHPSTPPFFSPLLLPSSSPLPSLSSPLLTWALPLAERWDSFTEAARCQERSSPRKAGQMYVGHCESEGGFSFSPSLLFSPPFCSFVLFGSLARSFSPHEWKDNIDLCQSRLLFSCPNR